MGTETSNRPSAATKNGVRWPSAALAMTAMVCVTLVFVLVPEHRGDIVAGIAVVWAVAQGFMRRIWGPVAAILLAAAIAIPCQGCGAGALRAHARASSVLVVAIQGADELADTGAEVALAACTDEACEDHVVEVTEAIDAGIAAAMLPVGAYVQSVEMALAGGDDVDVLSALLAVLARALAAWDDLVPLFVPLGVELPPLPASLRALVELLASPGTPS